MSIVSSSILRNDIDLNGNQRVIEEHNDSAGGKWQRVVWVAAGVDPATLLAAHAMQVAEELADFEARQVLS